MARQDQGTLWESTSWNVVARAAGDADTNEINVAWGTLIERYREPVIRAVRRILRGHPATDQILQGFLGYVFEHQLVPKADRERGRFRCYIQGVVRRYVLDALKKIDSRKAADVEELELRAPDGFDADDKDEAAWAQAVLDNVTGKLEEKGSRDAGILLRLYGIPPRRETDREALCAEYDINRNALNQALHRGRQELRKLILEEVSETVGGPQELNEEMAMIVRRLMAARPGLLDGRES